MLRAKENNADSRDRTSDLQIFSLTLSQLSYIGLSAQSRKAPMLEPRLGKVGEARVSGLRRSPSGQMDKASVSGAEDCGFESHLG